MSFKKEFLFPFLSHRTYFESYAWSVELATLMKTKLRVFTTTPSLCQALHSNASIYHSLLEAQGYYLQHYLQKGTRPDVLREPCIEPGELEEKLIFHLRQNPDEVVILYPGILLENQIGLDEIVKEAGGVIILHEARAAEPDRSIREHFFDRLRCVQLHKLPGNFLATLGKDRTTFNFLRELL